MTWTTFAVCAAAATMTSCITHVPVRTHDDVNANAPGCSAPGHRVTSIAALQAHGKPGDTERSLVSCVSEERHSGVPESPLSLPHDGFNVHVLEFDDDGVPWNRAQQERTFDALHAELRVKPAVVAVFVHGWKNNASVCNGNLSCFREVLEILSKGESFYAGTTGQARRVIGVYIGWRGGTINVKGLNATTFWGRKHTAHAIGDNGAVTAAIQRVRTIVATSPYRPNEEKPARGAFQDTSLVLVGHSFGGALLFSALATSLNASVGRAVQESAPPSSGGMPQVPTDEKARPVISSREVLVESSGDLVVLVNPAMEASRFANLAYTRNLTFKKEQVPLFMTLASEADRPVGGFFPIGQAFATVSRAARSRDFWFRMEKGFGLYEPYLTHRLVLAPQAQIPQARKISGQCRCSSDLGVFGDDLVKRLKPLYDIIRTADASVRLNAAMRDAALDKLKLAAYQETLFSRLEPVRDVDPNNPFVMATVDPAVVGGHSDIFNPRFMDFLIEYVIQSEIKRALVNDFGQKEYVQERAK